MAKYKILSTKKLEASQIELANKKDIEVIEKEFIFIQPCITEEIKKEVLDLSRKPSLDVVITSANVLPILEDLLPKDQEPLPWRIFCLSAKTKTAILQAGFSEEQIAAEANDAVSLAEAIILSGSKEVSFFCSNKRRDELPTLLYNSGVIVNEVILYDTILTPAKIDEAFDAVLFFSPSAVDSFFSVNQLKEETVCFAIGKTTTDQIAVHTANRIITSKSPRQESIISAMLFYFQTRPAEISEENENQANENDNEIKS
jgi:uroporphyrinogen-III synthase